MFPTIIQSKTLIALIPHNHLRTVNLNMGSDKFTEQHSFINKKDAYDFCDFFHKFIDEDYLADIEYVETRRQGKLTNLRVNFYQPNTNRIIYSHDRTARSINEEYDLQMMLRIDVVEDLKNYDSTEVKQLFEDIKLIFESDKRW